MKKSEILFNEKCTICNFEIKHYKQRSELNFVNCSEMGDKYLKRLHVRFEDGKELSGVDAFIYVWERTKQLTLKIYVISVVYNQYNNIIIEHIKFITGDKYNG